MSYHRWDMPLNRVRSRPAQARYGPCPEPLRPHPRCFVGWRFPHGSTGTNGHHDEIRRSGRRYVDVSYRQGLERGRADRLAGAPERRTAPRRLRRVDGPHGVDERLPRRIRRSRACLPVLRFGGETVTKHTRDRGRHRAVGLSPKKPKNIGEPDVAVAISRGTKGHCRRLVNGGSRHAGWRWK